MKHTVPIALTKTIDERRFTGTMSEISCNPNTQPRTVSIRNMHQCIFPYTLKICFNVSLLFSYQNEGMNVCEILETRK